MLWSDVVSDRSLKDLPYKIELNQTGTIEMTPVNFGHSLMTGRVIDQLKTHRADGICAPEVAIQTSIGVRVPDVCWFTTAFYQLHRHDDTLSNAPEICVEVLSPGNTGVEMQSKVRAYIEAGAKEVWLVELSGSIRFFSPAGEVRESGFCPGVSLAPVN